MWGGLLPRPRPAIPQCPVLASRAPRHISRGSLNPRGGHMVVPTEVETPRPSISCVQVGNQSLKWSYMMKSGSGKKSKKKKVFHCSAGEITFTVADFGAADSADPDAYAGAGAAAQGNDRRTVAIRPGMPVVVSYEEDEIQLVRQPDGTERELPCLIDPRTWDPSNKNHVYCGLLYSEQVVPPALKIKTLLVLVSGHQTLYLEPGQHKTPGDPTIYHANDRPVHVGVWVSKNAFWIRKPGLVSLDSL